MRPKKSYYVAGGSLRSDTPSYVARKADEELYEALQQGEFCYVLTSRQMGKTSLIVRTATRLRAEKVRTAVLDLTAIGQNVQPEQWYYGLLCRLGEQLGLEDELDAFWLEHERLGPLQRWIAAIREAILLRDTTPVVIFIDEIDAVRSLPISTGEFFAAIRECYNRRPQESEFDRLTFCLVGVASPTDLIRDTRTTPFNIGRRIELTDFTLEEAAPLEQGLGGGGEDEPDPFVHTEKQRKSLLRRILHWTGGHPYLTQRFCQAVAESAAVRTEADVDRLCNDLFLSPRARERDDNLIFVRDRILRSEADHVALLDMYGMIRAGKRVRNDETNPLVSILLLSGIVRATGGRLVVRNRIYAHVFNAEWVQATTPEAEVLRQRKAYRRGILRAAAVFGSLALVIGGLSFIAVKNAHRAERNARAAEKAEGEASRRAAEASRLLYIADMNLTQREWDANNVSHIRELLNETRDNPERGFEWNFWNHLTHRSIATFQREPHSIYAMAISPDEKRMVTASSIGQVVEWDIATRQIVHTFAFPSPLISSLAYSQDGKRLIAGGNINFFVVYEIATRRTLRVVARPSFAEDVVDGISPDRKYFVSTRDATSAALLDVETGRVVREIPVKQNCSSVAWSSDGKQIAVGLTDGSARLQEAATGKATRAFVDRGEPGGVALTFSRDGKMLAIGHSSGDITLWDVATAKPLRVLRGHSIRITTLAFSPDSRRLVTGSDDTSVRVWDTATGEALFVFKENRGQVSMVAWRHGNRQIIAADHDGSTRLYDVSAAREMPIFFAGSPLWGVSFGKNGQIVVASGSDGVARVWNTKTGREILALRGHVGKITPATFSHDGTRILTAGDDRTARIWDAQTGRCLLILRGHTKPINAAIFSQDDRFIVTGGDDYTARLWDAQTGRELRQFVGHRKSVESIALTPDGTRLVTGADDATAKVWDTTTGQELLTFHSPAEIWGVAIFPDGKRVVTSNLANTALVWDIGTGRILTTLAGHTHWVTMVAVSPDGRRILTGSRDRTVKLWDADSGRELLTFKGHTKQVSGVAFSADGNAIVTASGDGTARIWSIE